MYGKEFDSLNIRKYQPPIPRFSTFSPKIPSPYSTSCIHKTHLSALNHRLVAKSTDQQTKRDINNTETLERSRWNPTPQQLQALEEMYQGGTTTPTSEQIQQIAAILSQFGKIEGKNVFYWFQNHKFRERQKRRLRLESSCRKQPRVDDDDDDIDNLKRKGSGLSSPGIEVEQTKNCSTLSEEYVSIARAVVAESKTDEWIQFEERELQKRNSSTVAKHATWQMMEFPSSTTPTYLFNTITTTTTAPEALGTVAQMLLTPNNEVIESRKSHTLELFPLWNDDHGDSNTVNYEKNDGGVPITAITTNISTPIQFFEFLPTKN